MNRRLSGGDSSLNAVDENGNEYLAGLSTNTPSPEKEFILKNESNWKSELVRKAMATLPKREKDIISRRWLGEKQQTLEELGSLYGISRERIRQLETIAVKKISKYVRQVAH